ncbi:hypothetical protein PTKIN_Ptkin15bG0174300 [Pterospermum kingtungense]
MKRTYNLVSWDKVVQPKQHGGLGFRCLNHMNIAFMSKLGWRMMTEKEALWVKVVAGKYIHGEPRIDNFHHKQGSSNAWKGIVKANTILSKGTRSLILNGRDTLFWTDKWLMEEPLMNFLLSEFSSQDVYKRVSDYWVPRVGWNWDMLNGLLPGFIEDKLAAVVLNEDSSLVDGLDWGVSKNGLFSIRSAYDLSFGTGNEEDTLWNVIWKLDVPNRIRCFLWLVKHQRLMCNAERLGRGFTNDGCCALCHGSLENVQHVVRHCPEISSIWTMLLPADELHYQCTLDFDRWLHHNICSTIHNFANLPWNVVFATVIWWQWKWRNGFIFHGEKKSLDFKVQWIKSQASEFNAAFQKRMDRVDENVMMTRFLSWPHPPVDWVALNTDGCSKSSLGVAGCGGLLRDFQGNWLKGFTLNIGFCSAIEAELWGVLQGLRLAWSMGIRRVKLGIDSKLVVGWLNGVHGNCVRFQNLLSVIHDLLVRNWEVQVSHIYRECNRVADLLASIVVTHARGLCVEENPPRVVQDALWDDIIGVAWSRRIAVLVA